MRAIMIALSERGVVCFRGQVGQFFTKDGRPIRTGLPVGFSDLFCVLPDGRAAFLEIKTATGRIRPEQTAFLEAMRKRGAIAGVARSVADALQLM